MNNKMLNLEKEQKLNRDSKIINIEKERTSSLIQRHKNNITNSKNYNPFLNGKLKSKEIFLDNNNKSAIGHNLKKRKMDLSTESRNYTKGLNRHFNNSFNDSLIDKKFLNTMVNIEKIPKHNYESNNQSNIMNTIDNDKLDISNDYTTIGQNSNIKEIKDIKNNKKNENTVKRFVDLHGNKKSGSKNYYNTINNEYSNNKQKKIVQNTTNSAVKRKNSYKKFNNKKHNKVFNSYNLIS